MAQSVDSVNHALDRLASCRPFERSFRMRDLLTASLALRDETEKLHLWLIRAWDWLDAHPTHEEFVKRESLLLAEIQRYAQMHELLGKTLVAIGKETP